MALASSLLSYIRFFVFLSPMIVPIMAIFGSLFESNMKGFIYVFGLVIAMTFGKFIAPTVGKYVPHSGTFSNNFKPIIDPACNLVGTSAEGWGFVFSSPGPHALLLAFTTTYLLFPMFMNNNVNFLIVGGLLLLSALSAIMRVTPPMRCVSWFDVLIGWFTGFILGAIWYFTVIILGGRDSNLTYFETQKSDRQQCTVDKKVFRCRKSQ
mgnify:CR=1 FL=1